MHAGFSTLGTNAILVVLTQQGILLCLKQYLIAAMNSTPIICQHRLKNRAVKPSGPGALLSGIENKAILISSSVIG
jgi:hypothetical protein